MELFYSKVDNACEVITYKLHLKHDLLDNGM